MQDDLWGALAVPFGDDMDVRIRLATYAVLYSYILLRQRRQYACWYSDSSLRHPAQFVPWRTYMTLSWTTLTKLLTF